MIEFQYPYFFILLFLPPLIFVFMKPGKGGKDGIPAIFNPNLKWIARSYGKKAEDSKLISKFNIHLYIIWALLTFAMMHPQKIETISKTNTKGYDIMMVIDLSESMLALDMADIEDGDRRNRLDVVKQVAGRFIDGRQGDRLGLILFGDSAYLQTPLTLDGASVKTMLNLSEIGMAGSATAIGDALALAVKSLLQRPEGSRVIILLTDGTTTAGSISPFEAARLAKQYGIKIYSIGVGKKGAVPFPMQGGGINYVVIGMDDKVLRKISEDTGGAYFNATDEGALKEIYAKINHLEKTEAKTSEYVLRTQLYEYPLIIAMMFMMGLIVMRYNWSKFFFG